MTITPEDRAAALDHITRRATESAEMDALARRLAEDPATVEAWEHRRNGSNGHLLEYRSTRLADVTPERVSWVWPGRWPAGKLVVLDGDPDVGKSTLTLDLLARITTGRHLPGENMAAVPASPVVLMAAEDGLGDTIRPRLDAADADVTKVHHFDAVPTRDNEGNVVSWVPPTLPDDIAALEALIKETGAVVVVVDVLMAYLSGKADSHRDQDVRRALAPLAEMAERTGVCVVLIRHVPKSQRRAGQAIAAGSGSIGIVGAARAGMVAAPDPTDDTGQRRILARSKGNLAPPWPSLAYQLVSDDARGCARVEWLGESTVTGDELLAPRESEDTRSETEEAVDWLHSMLSDGPRQKSDLDPMARREGFSPKVIRSARERLGLVVERDENAHGRPSRWSLPVTCPLVTCPAPRAHKAQASDQGKHSESEGHVPSQLNGHVIGACRVCGTDCTTTDDTGPVHPLCTEEADR